jgi:Ni2+-binding GTPase involved in maturation of urease and hydrogenase
MFKEAIKHQAKLRLAIAGPAGSGKTYTGLLIARSLANGGKIAVVDTEHGSAS